MSIIDKKMLMQGAATFVAAVACSDAIREIATAMKRTDPNENALLRVGIAVAVVLVIVFIAYLWQTDESDETPAVSSVKIEEVKDSVPEKEAPKNKESADDSESTGSESASMESANVVFKRSSLPDAALSEAYMDYSNYLNAFA